jgi:hypothetical protein
MQFPVTLFHKDNGDPAFALDARHSKYTSYPIVVHTQEDYDRLGPGWHEDPVAAAEWQSEDPAGAVSFGGDVVQPSEDAIQAASDLLEANMDVVNESIEQVTDVKQLEVIAEVESAGKNRKGVQSAIAARLETLNS